ncbi:MAG: hypothetical protein M3Y22_01320 [Pseudomonadota bacterium]|nr:hypothetical protein [Pseudomonadota bacterium]
MRGLHHDPDTPPVGRQPSRVQIAPSKSYPWYGSIRGGTSEKFGVTGGERFTTQQQAALIQQGRDILTAESLLVKRQANDNELCWALGDLPPVYAFECPVLGRRKDGKVKVVSPSGDVKHVLPDGWAHRPYRRPRVDAYDSRSFR